MSIFTEKIDMLHGSIWDKMIIFAMPLAFMAFLEQVFNMVDIAVLGRFIGKEAVAAVGNNFSLVGLFISLFMGLSLGANVVIAQCIGGRRLDLANKAVHTAWLLALVSGVGITILGELVTDLFISLINVPPAVSQMAEDYLRTYLFVMPGISLYNFEAAMFRSKGDTRTPLLSLLLAAILNVVLDIWLVQWFENGIVGVALATVISISIAALVLLGQLMYAKDMLYFSFSRVTFERALLSEIVNIGWPAAMQGMVFCISNLLIQEAINSLGADAMAASSISITVELAVFCIINAFAQSCTTFVSQNFGAGNMKRCEDVILWALKLNMLFTAIISVLAMLFARTIIGFYNDDPQVIELGVVRMWYVVLPEVFQLLIDVFAAAMRGYGFSLAPALLTMFGICGIRITWLYTLFSWKPTFECLMLTYPISWLVTGSLMIALYLYFKRNLLQHMRRIV